MCTLGIRCPTTDRTAATRGREGRNALALALALTTGVTVAALATLGGNPRTPLRGLGVAAIGRKGPALGLVRVPPTGVAGVPIRGPATGRNGYRVGAGRGARGAGAGAAGGPGGCPASTVIPHL